MRKLRALLAFAFCVPTACVTWQYTNPADLHGAHAVRVETTTQRLEFDRARLRGDTIIGELGQPPRETAIPITSVRKVEERKLSAGRSLGLAAAGVAVALIGTAVVIVTLLSAAD